MKGLRRHDLVTRPCWYATLAVALLWPAAAFGETRSSCTLFDPERAQELDWTDQRQAVPIVDRVLAHRLRACFDKGPAEPIVVGDLHRLRTLRHQGDHLDAIVRLDGLELAVNLEELALPDNQIANLRPLASLTALTIVDLARNQLADAAPLVASSWLGSEVAVNLAGNPLGRASLKEVLPRLVEHGVALEFDRPDVLLFPSNSDGLLRIINHSRRGGNVEILGYMGYDGTTTETLEFELAGGGVANFDTRDLTAGNPVMGLGRGFGQVPTRMEFQTSLDVEVLVYERDSDGVLVALHDSAPRSRGRLQFDTVNPARNTNHEVVLLHRWLDVPEAGESLRLRAHDDTGAARETSFWLGPHSRGWVRVAELEDSRLGGEGSGKWRMETYGSSGAMLKGWSLLSSSFDRPVSNLSTRPHRLEAPLFPAAGDSLRTGFVRVANHSFAAGTVRIYAVDDAGETREPVQLALAARQTRHFNSRDLEAGNTAKGLSAGIGAGTGDWRLRFESDLDYRALTYVRHAGDGFVASMHDVAPNGMGRHRVATFAPASNAGSRSLLRIVNVGEMAAQVSVSGTDDRGGSGTGVVRLTMPAGAATTLTATQLERGDAELTGRLGDGEGMWRLMVESAEPLRVMSLMASDRRLTNISTAMRGPPGDSDGDGVPDYADYDDDNDGIADTRDALPYDPAESVDTDGDGIGNLADADDDGDGVPDAMDARPLDASGHEPPTVADLRHYRFVGEHTKDRAFRSVAVSDVDCDGARDIVIGAPTQAGGEHLASNVPPGAVYLASAADLPAADAADGQADGTIYLGRIAAEPRSWKLVGNSVSEWISTEREAQHLGHSVAPVGDINGDGCADLLLGASARHDSAGSAYLVSASDLPAADGADAGGIDGVVDVSRLIEQPGSYEFLGERREYAGAAVAGVPDWDADGFDDLVVGAPRYSGTDGTEEDDGRRGAVYMVARRDLATLDAADGDADGRIRLASVEAGLRSRRIVGAPGEGLGSFLTVGEFDGDSLADLAVGGEPGALYLLAAADAPSLHAVAEDGTVDVGRAALGKGSWLLLGPEDDDAPGDVEWRIEDLSTGDLDGDGLDDVVVSGKLRDFQDGRWGESFPTYVVPASALGAADRADGARDRVVRLELAASQAGSLVLAPEGDRAFRSAIADVDGDGLGDLVLADGLADAGGRCQVPRWHGAAWLASGAYLRGLDAMESPIALGNLEPDAVGLWKVIGAGAERLGYAKPLLATLDDDGAMDMIIGSYLPFAYGGGCGSGLLPGMAVAISTGVLEDADAAEGSAGVVRLGSVWGDYNALIEDALQVQTTQFDENLMVMEISGETNGLLRYEYFDLVPKLHEGYRDVFDFLILQHNLDIPWAPLCAWFGEGGNAVAGTGLPIFEEVGRLTGVVNIQHRRCLDYDTLAHEIMHNWANFVLPTTAWPHWGFSSANGVLGGFDRSTLVDLGDGRYAARYFDEASGGIARRYSPIELYLAGWLPADEVPATWVAREGRWTGEVDEERGRVFAASGVEEWPVERIVEEHGLRTPTPADSQKAFRAAFVLVADREHPPEWEALEEMSALVRGFSHQGPDSDDTTFNFHEATGGRATLASGDLTRWRKPGAEVSLAKSRRAHATRPFVARQGHRFFGGARKDDLHRFCGTGHVGHGPGWRPFANPDGPPPRLDGEADTPGPHRWR